MLLLPGPLPVNADNVDHIAPEVWRRDMASEMHEGEELELSGPREPVVEYLGDDAGELTDTEVEAGETRHSERNED